jgi:Family of unknown function (DUF5724)/Domain of unknown function (DUF4132)
MLRHEDASTFVRDEQTANWTDLCLSAISAELPEELRPAAYALLNRDENGRTMTYIRSAPEGALRHREAIARGFKALTALDPARRTEVFATLVPRVAIAVEAAWQLLGRLPYQTGWRRKAFRAPDNESASYTARVIWLRSIISGLVLYRDKDLPWFATRAPYFGTYSSGGHVFGILFAAAIDQGGAEGEAVYDVLVAAARGEHPIGRMGRHVTTGLLAAGRPDGWMCIERLLLAAQREEGLRQVILETADEAHPQAFRRLLRLILDHDLVRFPATVRATDVWFGFEWRVEDVRAVRNAIDAVLHLLDDPTRRRHAMMHGNPQETYFALWATAFEDAADAISAAIPVLADVMPERRLAAAHLLGQVNLPEAQVAFLPLLDDPDLRVALCAFWCVGSMASVHTHDDLFERLERLLGRVGGKEKTLKSGVWPWLEFSADRQRILHAMIESLGARDPTRLIPYLPLMSALDRACAAEKLAELPTPGEDVRATLYELIGDRSRMVRSRALKLIASRPLDEDGAYALERLLRRKSSDLRRGILALLLKRSDEAVLASAQRLFTASHPLQRVAGLDVLNELVMAGRAVEHCRLAARLYRDNRQVVTVEETTLVDAILAASHVVEAPTRDNVLGLISPEELSPRVPPRHLSVNLDTPAARRCLCALDALVEEYRTTPVRIKTWRGQVEMLLGNLNWHFPDPDPTLAAEEDAQANLPLAEVWRRWERERPAELRDADGLELLRARLLLNKTRAVSVPVVSGSNKASSIIAGGIMFPLPVSEFFPSIAPDHASLSLESADARGGAAPSPAVCEPLRLSYLQFVNGVLGWLVRLQGISVAALNLLLDTAETALASMSLAELERARSGEQHGTWVHSNPLWELSRDGSLVLLHQYRRWYHAWWDHAHHRRYWQLLHWLDQPVPGLGRQCPPLLAVLEAHRIGEATEADILDQLGGPTGRSHGQREMGHLHMLSGRRLHPLMEEYSVLQRLVTTLRERVLEVELARGEMPTAATGQACSLRYSGGVALFIRLVAKLAPADLARGYAHDNESKEASFSHLLRVTHPGTGDTLEEFVRQVTHAGLDTKRLVAAAVYAPQWACHVERALAWPRFEDAVWWIYAHTKDTSWSSDKETHVEWGAQVTERTPLRSEELLAGAVDVAWFWRCYQGLGAERWKEVYAAGTYASKGTGHSRARLFADAMTGKVSVQELQQRIVTRRQQDAVRALGLVPLSADNKAREAEIAERYETLQEFRRTGRRFGTQRRASEETATHIGLENLARTAGYPDPIRLQWAMEARTATDWRDGALIVEEGDTRVSLALDTSTAELQLTCARGDGKMLKALPARLKKQPRIAALMERKREVEQQIARLRLSLEAAMCRGDRFTAAELVDLLAHPVISSLLQKLVFVRVGDEGGETDSILGYPLRREDGTLCFYDYGGVMTAVDPAASDLRLAHPYDLFTSGAWHVWQHECFTASRIQPFKQVFRELYVCTRSEMRDGDNACSQRYSGHQVQRRQALALLGQRGWVAHHEEGVRRTFYAEGLSATLSFAQRAFTPAEVGEATLEDISFTRHGEWKPIALASVPPLVFSEVMRDLDLVVSVAHSGGVDPEATVSTVEMRAALVGETCTLLGLNNVSIKSTHAVVEGTLGSYSVHLGSAVAHRQPGGALCIIPVHAQQRGRLFLPFADDDPKTAEVITKIVTLARDKDIKDPSILEQIL